MPTSENLIDQCISAYKDGKTDRAAQLLAEVLRLDPKSERAWLWLSEIVRTDAERLFCIKRILAINPENVLAQHGLQLLPPGLEPVKPSLQDRQDGEVCTFPGCSLPVSQPGLKFCYKHWKAVNAPLGPAATLNATSLGERFKLSGRGMNLLLAELGWITREKKGWVPTPQGRVLGARRKDHHSTGIPFVLWPDSILGNKALLSTVRSFSGETEEATEVPAPEGKSGFRNNLRPTLRATDGHWVRSRAEMLVDNWLYMSGIVHAYERRVPVEEELYCDFYIPAGHVYVEFWGLLNDPKYAARRKEKLAIYQKYKLNLIELTDEELRNLDDCLPKMLLRFNVVVS